MDSEIFKNDQDYWMVADNIKDIYLSDGSLSTLLDFERVLDEMDIYAFKNWELGELVQGPVTKRYSVGAMFMWPFKLMPDPRGAKRLLHLGCKILWKKTKIRVPVEVLDYEDFQPGTRYPKMKEREIWLVYIEMPKELMDDIREGSIDLADQTIDLEELDNAYEDDLDKEGIEGEGEDISQQGAQGEVGIGGGLPPPPMGQPQGGPM